MRFAALALALLVAPLASAQTESLILEAHDGGGEYWFQIQGSSERNPDLALKPGASYEVRLENLGSAPHNVRFEGVDVATPMIRPGENATIDFTVPSDAKTLGYWCDPHRFAGMEGVAVSSANENTPGLGPLGLIGALLVVLVARSRTTRR